MRQVKAALFGSLVLSACNVATPPGPVDDPVPAPIANAVPVRAGEVEAPTPTAALPQSCADIRNLEGTGDGDYTLYVGGDRAKPWVAYCANMATAPAEFLSLVDVLGDSNFGQYTAGGAASGTSVRTSYIRLRIDPQTLRVDIGDQTFAVSSGALQHTDGTPVASMPIGVAMSCDGSPSGLANIDLSGTPFAVAAPFGAPIAPFDVPTGWDAQGGATGVDAEHQIWDVTGGGSCGWVGPSGVAYNPFNTNGGGYVLQLQYVE